MIILKTILKQYDGRLLIGLINLSKDWGQWQCYEHGTEISGYIECGSAGEVFASRVAFYSIQLESYW
jgi:hypothetical protein